MIPSAGIVLLLLRWRRYAPLFAKAGHIDAQYRELGTLAWQHQLIGMSLGLYAKARTLIVVLAAKLGHDAAFLAGAYLFGMAAGWLWGVP